MPPTDPPTPPTLRAIAKASEVSLATVSEALRGSPKVAPATAAHVRATAEAMGWRRNPMVHAWMKQVRSGRPAKDRETVAFLFNEVETLESLLADPERYIYQSHLQGARERAEQLGYRIDVFNLGDTPAARLEKILYNRGIRGLILSPWNQRRPAPAFDWSRLACVLIGSSERLPPMHRTISHHFHTAATAVEKLHAHGLRRIGLAFPRRTHVLTQGKLLGGYLAGLHDAGLPTLKTFIPPARRFTRKNFQAWLTDERPDAVLALHKVVPDWIRGRKDRVDGDLIRTVNLDLHPDPKQRRPGESGVDTHPEHIGAAALERVADQLERNETGLPNGPKITLVESHWIDATTKPCDSGST